MTTLSGYRLVDTLMLKLMLVTSSLTGYVMIHHLLE